MKYINQQILVIISIGIFFFTGCASGNKSVIYLNREFSPKELQQDLNFLVQTDKQVHPNLFVNTPESTFDSALTAAQNKLTRPMSSLEFYKIIAPVVSCLRDGHTTIEFPYGFRHQYLTKGGKAVPFDIYINENKIFVNKNYSSDSSLSPNSEIISINSVSSHNIINSLGNYTFGELESKRNYDIERLFKPYLWAHYNFGGPFNVRYFSSINNQEYSKYFTGITQSEFDSLSSNGTNTKQQYQSWTLEVFNNDKIALIDVNTFGYAGVLDRFRSFLDSSFTIIKQKGIRELIIDVRNNSGGETELVEALIDYTANKPWTAFSRADYKFSDQAKADLIPWYLRWVPIKPFITLFSFMYTSAKIDKAEYDSVDNRLLHVYMKPGKLKANPLRYTGDTYLLINSGSYSASVIFAAVMKDYGFATLVGEETGQPANPYGGTHFFFLPNTHLLACVPTGRCYRPSGIETNHGVFPDFEVKKSFNTITSQKDTVLEFTKELIKKNIKAGVSQ